MALDIFWIDAIKPMRLAVMPRPRAGDWLEEEVSRWHQANISCIVSLLQPCEVQELALTSELALCQANGIEFLQFPIQDRGVPESLACTVQLVQGLVQRLHNGRAVAIHCRAGIGRSGLIAACVLLNLGISVTDAFALISQARSVSVPDTAEQIDWANQFLIYIRQST